VKKKLKVQGSKFKGKGSKVNELLGLKRQR